MLLVTTYCLFEPPDMLKCKLYSVHIVPYRPPPPLTARFPRTVCFFVFDQDKAGYFEEEELKSLMNALHKVKPGETVKGNVKAA